MYRYQRIFEYRHILLAIPPPFNLPICLWDILKHNLALCGFKQCQLVQNVPPHISSTARNHDGRHQMAR